VSIIVDDVNDNDPVFNQSSYLAHVMENSNVSTSVVTVYAADQDQEANGRVSYAITSGNTGDAFEINNQTGMVTVKGVIDRENIKEYSLTVQAEDGGHPSSRKVSLVFRAWVGLLPYMGYVGMCGHKGYGALAVLVINRVSILGYFGLKWGMVFILKS